MRRREGREGGGKIVQYVRKRKMVFSCCVEKDSGDAIINSLAFQLGDEGKNDFIGV